MAMLDNWVSEYVKNKEYRVALGLPEEVAEEYELLAQGEYNANYFFVHPVTCLKLILRVNCGSQMHLNHQISYEARALSFLAVSGRTPEVLWVDENEDHGVLVEKYLPGEHLDYKDDKQMKGVAACLADIHSLKYPEEESVSCNPEKINADVNKLIAPTDSLVAILEECEHMIAKYMDSDLGSNDTKKRIRMLLDKAWDVSKMSDCLSPYRCCINTELNSTNFLIDGDSTFLVDWEKPLYGDPAQDLGHFLAPTTTFWKTDVILSEDEINSWIKDYIDCVDDRYDTTGIEQRTNKFLLMTCMRGICWCAMAWVEYQEPGRLLRNESTANKLEQYLSDNFLSMIEAIYK